MLTLLLIFHYSLTHEQDPEILEFLHLGQQLTRNSEGGVHIFPAEHHVLRFGGADSHSTYFLAQPF